MTGTGTDESTNGSDIDIFPGYTLRKKYTKRPSHVLKLKLAHPDPNLQLTESNQHRMWSFIDDSIIVIKTWQFHPLPQITNIFQKIQLETVNIEFNIGPHEDDILILKEISTLDTSSFSLEFREQWAGLYPVTSDLLEKENEFKFAYSDNFLKPFLESETALGKLRVLTGKFTTEIIKMLPRLINMKFLGIRVNHEEYIALSEVTSEFHSLERIHLLPQWPFNKNLQIPPIKFSGVLTVYYWDFETTKAVKKAFKKWKTKSTRRKLFCWS